MAWNEPGGDKDRDPWRSGDNDKGPPDLDEIVRNMQDKLNGLFGSKGRKPSRGNGSDGGGDDGGSQGGPPEVGGDEPPKGKKPNLRVIK